MDTTMADVDDYEFDFINPLGEGAFGAVFKAMHKRTGPGEGAFGAVFKATHKRTGQQLAAKRIMLAKNDTSYAKNLRLVTNEIKTLSMVKEHSNIVQF